MNNGSHVWLRLMWYLISAYSSHCQTQGLEELIEHTNSIR